MDWLCLTQVDSIIKAGILRKINYQAPPTGDKNQLNALFIIAGICLTGILIYAGRKQNEK